jgi:hypothetical protein
VESVAETDDVLAPYARLLELARLAEELVANDAYDQLAAVWDERDAIVAGLPLEPPRLARAILVETSRVVRSTELLLRTGIEGSQRSLAALDVGRRAVAGYGGDVVPGLLDASA